MQRESDAARGFGIRAHCQSRSFRTKAIGHAATLSDQTISVAGVHSTFQRRRRSRCHAWARCGRRVTIRSASRSNHHREGTRSFYPWYAFPYLLWRKERTLRAVTMIERGPDNYDSHGRNVRHFKGQDRARGVRVPGRMPVLAASVTIILAVAMSAQAKET